ncbi:hypothetical protein GXM_03303 [Nostoc sphaeroides CCNUC1]|uniref:Uncharacterized protein n=1 Tax=Nostoc sphaeroides CCNUC1 TaxID=2653204 RepID=A0A5P8VZJ9_9NOSO|nr:hypothetical protein GXM_03303 [Nostoc sphaeroides CCNUC1]
MPGLLYKQKPSQMNLRWLLFLVKIIGIEILSVKELNN